MNNALTIALRKINMCLDYQAVYSMEPDFNEIGLTVQTTSNNRMILCKIKNGRPLAESIIDDYMYIGSLDTATNEVSERAINKIVEFMHSAGGEKGELKNVARDWQDGLRIYGKSVRIAEGTWDGEGGRTITESTYPMVEN